MTAAHEAASIAAREVPRKRGAVAEQSSLTSVLACPRCRRASLRLETAGWICQGCGSGYPLIGEVPWLFPDPRQSLSEWRGRLNLLAQHLGSEAAAMRAAIPSSTVAATRRRLELVAAAHEDQVARLRGLLAPLGLGQSDVALAAHHALGTRLPIEQGLTNYYVNLHRDWAWGDAENDAAIAELRHAAGGDLRGLGATLVQGAGAGRLAYDLHQGGDAPLTVATDFNPLLLFVARKLVAGREIELYEFPIAPQRLEHHAVLRRLRSPGAARAGLELVAADALQPPFADGAFDTVVTPWFIDIIGEPFERVAARINLLLKPGGRWINSGSLAFSRAAHADRIGVEEVLEMLPNAGFDAPQLREAEIPYMRSPASRHSRRETVLTWVARKAAGPTTAPRARVLPEWLIDAAIPVPRTREFEMQSISSRMHAFLLALINGERSMRDMARMIVEAKLMSPEDAEAQVRVFLLRLYEQTDSQ